METREQLNKLHDFCTDDYDVYELHSGIPTWLLMVTTDSKGHFHTFPVYVSLNSQMVQPFEEAAEKAIQVEWKKQSINLF